MFKKIILFLATIFLSLTAAGTVSAVSDGSYIQDDINVLTYSESKRLNEEAKKISDTYNFTALLILTDSAGEDLSTYAQEAYQREAGDSDGILLLVDNKQHLWHIHFGGNSEQLLGEGSEDTLWEAYDAYSTWYGAAMNYLSQIKRLLDTDYQKRLMDEADLLTDQEEQDLLETLDEISLRQKLDVVVVTVDSTGGLTPQDFADDYYDYNGYGQGNSADGILLLISMAERDWYLSTKGYGITVFTDAGLDYLSEQFLSDLSAGNYSQAFMTFARQSDAFITQAREDKPFDRDNLPKRPLAWYWIPAALGAGFLLALIYVEMLRGQLKTVHSSAGAADYLKKGSLIVTNSREYFRNRTVTRTAKPKNTSSGGGGSSTHRSSSGSSHGGRGGKF